jgi:hypothetical protein
MSAVIEITEHGFSFASGIEPTLFRECIVAVVIASNVKIYAVASSSPIILPRYLVGR